MARYTGVNQPFHKYNPSSLSVNTEIGTIGVQLLLKNQNQQSFCLKSSEENVKLCFTLRCQFDKTCKLVPKVIHYDQTMIESSKSVTFAKTKFGVNSSKF